MGSNPNNPSANDNWRTKWTDRQGEIDNWIEDSIGQGRTIDETFEDVSRNTAGWFNREGGRTDFDQSDYNSRFREFYEGRLRDLEGEGRVRRTEGGMVAGGGDAQGQSMQAGASGGMELGSTGDMGGVFSQGGSQPIQDSSLAGGASGNMSLQGQTSVQKGMGGVGNQPGLSNDTNQTGTPGPGGNDRGMSGQNNPDGERGSGRS